MLVAPQNITTTYLSTCMYVQAVAAVTKDGEPAKTVLWAMAPELMVDQKHSYGPATDIWALG